MYLYISSQKSKSFFNLACIPWEVFLEKHYNGNVQICRVTCQSRFLISFSLSFPCLWVIIHFLSNSFGGYPMFNLVNIFLESVRLLILVISSAVLPSVKSQTTEMLLILLFCKSCSTWEEKQKHFLETYTLYLNNKPVQFVGSSLIGCPLYLIHSYLICAICLKSINPGS